MAKERKNKKAAVEQNVTMQPANEQADQASVPKDKKAPATIKRYLNLTGKKDPSIVVSGIEIPTTADRVKIKIETTPKVRAFVESQLSAVLGEGTSFQHDNTSTYTIVDSPLTKMVNITIKRAVLQD